MLALGLVEDSDWSRAVAAYKERMFARAPEAAAGAMAGLDFVSEHALAHVLGHFEEIQRMVDAPHP